ncbi:hypothetical protein FDG2_3834 [Candidatus Protofrankia californiensis]|uniref:Uncharacterized protein n=1 Tax=Candidatus Protofrankia californiensis TaxID=1839754 RepID=A0A1C3P187_9ACTN|nr:hypothetical protein FDG2_3834 [Candidatus Protofrankia californiensis]
MLTIRIVPAGGFRQWSGRELGNFVINGMVLERNR